ncbi:MAG: type II 3-dehydroquinate dehydratase [Pseudomonadota bacterium]
MSSPHRGRQPAPVRRKGDHRRILVIHGPNLNLLGNRLPEVYGTATLDEIDHELRRHAERRGALVEAFQSNCEGEIVTRIQEAAGAFDGIVINPAAYTHTSVAIRDALEAAGVPAVEVHLSNVHRREAFRSESLIAPACLGRISGFGAMSYYLGLQAVIAHLDGQNGTGFSS